MKPTSSPVAAARSALRVLAERAGEVEPGDVRPEPPLTETVETFRPLTYPARRRQTARVSRVTATENRDRTEPAATDTSGDDRAFSRGL